jgi:U3 small nucleolar RNA-associated protein 7
MERKFKPKSEKFGNKFKPKFNKFNNDDKPKLKTLELEEHQIHKFKRSSNIINKQNVETRFFRNKYGRQEHKFKYAVNQAARAEVLLNEDEGYLVAEEGEETTEFTQDDIKKAVDITSAAKSFKLNLEQFGPYRVNYTRNGRHLLMGGKKGHLAAFDWISKKLYCEFSVMEEIFDVKWLHLETLFAVAQKKWVHFYDNKGIEIHCVKKMYNVNQLEFLPFHFLLASGSNDGYLKWLDVSIGEMVTEFKSTEDRIQVMKQNPSNAVIAVGGAKGVVSFWSPSMREPLVRVLCHPSPITGVAFSPSGDKMVTTGVDRRIKLWDVRTFKDPIAEYITRTPVNHVSMSQKNSLAIALGNVCEVLNISSTGSIKSIHPYLRHIEDGPISDLEFVVSILIFIYQTLLHFS